MKTLVSSAALAFVLASATPARAQTIAEADAFVADAEQQLNAITFELNQTAWVREVNISPDTDALLERVSTRQTELAVNLAVKAAKFANVTGLSFDTKRKLDMMRSGNGTFTLPAPTTSGAAAELSAITTRMSGVYSTGSGTLDGKPLTGSDIEAEMGQNRDPAKLTEMWVSWHDTVGKPMRADYTRMVSIANDGAKELGYSDVGAMWRSSYDMPADDFTKLADKLWEQVKPLYLELHCFTRAKLNAKYGDAVQPAQGPIRADLLGNMWGQSWGNIYDVVAPAGSGDVGYDIGKLLTVKKIEPVGMVKIAEGFFSSLGFAPLPDTFWTRSQFTKPRDREVVCHASAWDIDGKDDIRIKMCTKVNSDDFVTIHHELGHNYYQRAYNKLPFLYLNGANDGFHEAIGDAIALSITPEYLVQIGLMDRARIPSADKDTGLLLRQAMDKVAFLPFGLLVDKWRWGVFNGTIPADRYNQGWTDLRLKYQGIVPPVARTESNFDPGAKYHIPGNTPYARYFLARILQFQFFKAACDIAKWQGPLHRCSFYGNKKVGTRLNAMLAMGVSKPWPDALQAFTGKREIDGTAMITYFKPLMGWLKTENKGRQCGW